MGFFYLKVLPKFYKDTTIDQKNRTNTQISSNFHKQRRVGPLLIGSVGWPETHLSFGLALFEYI